MDDDSGRVRTPADKPGGTVEPAKRVEVVKEKYQTLVDRSAVRYELRDPLAELTYRATNQADIVAKAEQLGSTLFTAIDADGRRTPIRKIDGSWRALSKLPARAPGTDHVVDDESERTDARRASPVDATTDGRKNDGSAKQPSVTALARVEAEAERAATVARLETALRERYVVKRAAVIVNDITVGRMEYRYRGDTTRIAFTESTFKLATDTNNPSVARSMVDVAEARNWPERPGWAPRRLLAECRTKLASDTGGLKGRLKVEVRHPASCKVPRNWELSTRT